MTILFPFLKKRKNLFLHVNLNSKLKIMLDFKHTLCHKKIFAC